MHRITFTIPRNTNFEVEVCLMVLFHLIWLVYHIAWPGFCPSSKCNERPGKLARYIRHTYLMCLLVAR